MANPCIKKDTKLYKELVELNYNANQISKINIAITSPNFKTWYGKGERDVFEMPYLKEGRLFVNDNKQTVSLNDLQNDENFDKHESYVKTLTILDNIHEVLKDLDISLIKQTSALDRLGMNIKSNEGRKAFETFKSTINAIDKNDYKKSLLTWTKYLMENLNKYELEQNKYESFDRNTLENNPTIAFNHNGKRYSSETITTKDAEDNETYETKYFENGKELKVDKFQKFYNDYREKRHKEFLNGVRTFLYSFHKIKNLETPIDDEDLKTIIKTLKDVESRVTELNNKMLRDSREIFHNMLKELSHNPDIINGVMKVYDAHADSNKAQLWLDSAADSDTSVVALVAKKWKLLDEETKEQAEGYKRKWRSFIKTFDGQFATSLDRLLERQDGDKTGRLIQKYNEKYYDNLYDIINRRNEIRDKFTENSSEYRKVNDEFNDYIFNNQELEYIDEFYLAMNDLIPEAKEAKLNIDTELKEITKKGVEKFTTNDWNRIRELNQKLKELKNPYVGNIKKTGIDLEIANSLFEHGKKVSEFYETIKVNQKQFDKARKEATTHGEEYLKEWDINNTVTVPNQNFWDEFEFIVAQFPENHAKETINKKIKQLTLAYLDENGDVKVDELPDNIRKELDDWQKAKEDIKLNLDENEKERLKSIYAQFNSLVQFVPTEYYQKLVNAKVKEINDLERQIELAEESDVTVKDKDRKELERLKKEWSEWINKTHNANEYTGEITPISLYSKMIPIDSKYMETKPNNRWEVKAINDGFRNPNYEVDKNGYGVPKDKHINSEWNNLTQKDKENLEFISDFLNELVAHNNRNFIGKGGIPAIPKNKLVYEKFKKEQKELLLKNITDSGEIVKHIPFDYVTKFAQESKKDIPEDATDEQIEEIKKENKAIERRNKTNHGSSINYDLENTMEVFINTALKNRARTENLLDFDLILENAKRMNILATNSAGKQIYDLKKGEVTKAFEKHEVSAENSNMVKQIENFLDTVLYNETEKDEGELSDWVKKIQNFNSFRAMGFNVLSGINNTLVGNLMERIEAAGGRFYNYQDYRRGQKLYYNNLINYISEHNTKESSSLLTAIMKDQDILISEDELANIPEGGIETFMAKAKMVRDAGYFFQHIGEHQIQNGTLLACMNSHRIVDGKIISWNEFYESKKKNIKGLTKEEAYKTITENQELKKILKEEFDSYTSYLDAFELKDGYAKLKDGITLNKHEAYNFKIRIIAMNQRLHGIYTAEDYGTLKKYALGRLAMQFRNWMRPSWNKRWGAKFGKSYYNENVRDYEQGMYVTTAKFLWSPFSNSWAEHKKAQENVAIAAYKTILSGIKDTFSNAKINWHTMTEGEKADVRRTAAEFTFLMTVIALGFLAKNMKADADDDEKLKKKILILTMYQCDRLFGELTPFTPLGIPAMNKMFSTPAPVMNLLEDVTKFGGALFMYPFRDDEEREFGTGIYHGQDRVSVYFQRLLPIWNHVVSMMNINESNQRYGIFRGN